MGIGGGSRRSRAIIVASGMQLFMMTVSTSDATASGIFPCPDHSRTICRASPSNTTRPSIWMRPITPSCAM